MFDTMTTAEKIVLVLVILFGLAMSPLIYEQATAEEEPMNEQYWLKCGYDPTHTGRWEEETVYELP